MNVRRSFVESQTPISATLSEPMRQALNTQIESLTAINQDVRTEMETLKKQYVTLESEYIGYKNVSEYELFELKQFKQQTIDKIAQDKKNNNCYI